MAKKAAAATASAAAHEAGDYTVLARRYRPTGFDELIGQEPIAQALKNAIESNRVAHAYLFIGTRGVGKTSTARILAKALNCEKGPTAEPCGKCEACQAIAAGDDVDVIEIDGASNRGLDDVRELRANAQYRSQRSRHKIYIIDEVHMLTREAFNALLKTLEEPPPHVKFIFATTEANKVPITITSRCQRFEFVGIGTERIEAKLKEIVKKEGKEADEDALAMIARRAAGSMRDAQSLLDQALAFTPGKLTVAAIHQLLGSANDEQVAELAAAILDKEQSKALTLLQAALERSVQPGELTDQLIDVWRKLMLLKSAGQHSELAELSAKAKQQLAARSQQLSLETILAGLDILVASKAKLRVTAHPKVVLEMAVLRLCLLAELTPLSTLSAELANLLSGGGLPRTASLSMSSASQTTTEPATKAPTTLASAAAAARTVPVSTQPPPTAVLSAATLGDLWQQILLAAGPLFADSLGKCVKQTIVPPMTLLLSFPRASARDRELVERKLDRVAEIVKRLVGESVIIRTELVGEATEAPVEVAPRPSKEAVTKKAAAQHPLVKQAVEQLGAEMLRIDDGFGTET